jgi:hypothetical protein
MQEDGLVGRALQGEASGTSKATSFASVPYATGSLNSDGRDTIMMATSL